ncbi:MAG: hypothetical protein L0228_20655 [Planctomycetes bacterium]|nr:hypothetical protein [Planctomycetota bacterium]
MSNSKKRREEAKRRLKREPQQREYRRERNAPVAANVIKPDIHREIRYISQLAQPEESRMVVVGNLVLFSTRSRDAWLLDLEDDFALCLCRDGEPQPFRIIDTPDTFAIEWTARFTIEGAEFIVQERSGRIVAMHGYPTTEISAACRG